MKDKGEEESHERTRPSTCIKHNSAAIEERDRKPTSWSTNWPCNTGVQGETEESQASPDWEVAGLISKSTYLLVLSAVAIRRVGLRTCPPEFSSL